MIATNELRFVEREVPVGSNVVRLERTLQQKWENTYWTIDESGNKFIEHEWRDVPVEKETDRG